MYKIICVVLFSLLSSSTVVAGGHIQQPAQTVAQTTGVSVGCAQALLSTSWDESKDAACSQHEMQTLIFRCTEPSPTTLRCAPVKGMQITFSARGRIIGLTTPTGHKTF